MATSRRALPRALLPDRGARLPAILERAVSELAHIQQTGVFNRIIEDAGPGIRGVVWGVEPEQLFNTAPSPQAGFWRLWVHAEVYRADHEPLRAMPWLAA